MEKDKIMLDSFGDMTYNVETNTILVNYGGVEIPITYDIYVDSLTREQNKVSIEKMTTVFEKGCN